MIGKLGAGHATARAAKSVGANVGLAVAHNVGCATLVLALEVEGCSEASGTRRAISTRRLARGLDITQVRGGRHVRSRDRAERVARSNGIDTLGSPVDLVELYHVLVVHDGAGDVPQLDAVVDTQTRGGRGRHDIAAVRTPLTDTWVSTLNGGDLAEVLLQIVDVDLASQVTKTGNQNESTSRREGDGVSGRKGERMLRNSSVVENGGLGWHVTIHNTKLFRVWRPRNVVDRTLLVQRDAGVEGTGGAEKIQGSFTIIALSGAVNVGLCQDNQAGAVLVPLQLDLVTLEECLLGDRAVEERNVEDLNGSRLALDKVLVEC